MEQNVMTRDKTWIGVVLGTIVPVLFIYAYYYFSFSAQLDFGAFVDKFKTSNSFLTAISTLLILANALLFGLFVQFRKLNTAKGVFIPTIIIGILVLGYKYFG